MPQRSTVYTIIPFVFDLGNLIFRTRTKFFPSYSIVLICISMLPHTYTEENTTKYLTKRTLYALFIQTFLYFTIWYS